MKGYYKNPDETKSVLADDFYHTGDYGFIDSDGYLFITSRRTDLIVTGGENVNPSMVENAILQSSNIDEVCVVGIPDKHWGQIVCAAIVLKGSYLLTESELKNFLKEKLTSFMIPKKIIFIDQLPKTSLGKIERKKISALFTDK
jgi:acyl-CoA synthetase (AMP-forming)/AMP-acid ligase II